MAIQEYLPGRPKKQHVKDVRSHFWHYGIRPNSTTEIATQYLVLLLVDMKEGGDRRLPYRASKVIPDELRSQLSSNPALWCVP